MQPEHEHPRFPATWEANLLALATSIVVLAGGTAAAVSGLSFVMIAAQTFIILPTLLWIIIRRFPLRTSLRFHPINRRTAIWSLWIGLACWPVVAGTSALIEKGLALIGPLTQAPSPAGLLEGALYAFVLIVLAPLTEEPVFRGFVLGAWMRRGATLGLVISGLLFAMFHFQLAALVPMTFLGFALSLLAWRSNSLFSSMIAHACYNTVGALFILIPWLREIPAWPLAVAGAVCLPITAWLLGFFARRFPAPEKASPEPDRSSRIWTILSLLAFLVMAGLVAAGEIAARLAPAVPGP